MAAIEEVERRFGVRFDYSDARNWTAASEVFVALRQEELSLHRRNAPVVVLARRVRR